MPITREQHRTQADGGPEVAVTTWCGEETPTHQLLIVQPALAAIIYASNSKRGCFTGFYQKTAPK